MDLEKFLCVYVCFETTSGYTEYKVSMPIPSVGSIMNMGHQVKKKHRFIYRILINYLKHLDSHLMANKQSKTAWTDNSDQTP